MLNLCLTVEWVQQRLCITEPFTGVVRWQLRFNGASFEGDKMQVTLTDVQGVAAAISVVTAKGNPAAIDGQPVWASSDEAGVTVTPAPDGMSAQISAVGPLGTYQVTVEVDADLGAGVKPLIGILDVIVVASEAVSVSFGLGTPA